MADSTNTTSSSTKRGDAKNIGAASASSAPTASTSATGTAGSARTSTQETYDSSARTSRGGQSGGTEASRQSPTGESRNSQGTDVNNSSARGSSQDSGLASSVQETVGRFADQAREAISDFDVNGLVKGAKDFFSENDLPAMGREYAGRIDRQARANPWMSIGLAGAAGIALGYLLGRSMTSSAPADFARGNFSEGIDE